jgi:GDP-L-fucose synthase
LCDKKFPLINIGTGDIYSIKNLANLIKYKTSYKGKIYFNKKYPNGVINKDLNLDIMKKLHWKHKVSLNKGLDIVLRDLKI